jgi:hypothetical protein
MRLNKNQHTYGKGGEKDNGKNRLHVDVPKFVDDTFRLDKSTFLYSNREEQRD